MPPSFTASLILRGRDQASAAVKGVQRSFGSLNSFLASKFVFTAGDVFRAVGAISDALERATQEAIKSEQATRKLDVALASAGDNTQKTKDATEAWTKSLQASTTTSQEQIKEAAALALSFGVATEDLEKFTRTALDFAPRAEIGFTEAVRRMGRALSGSVEDLAKFAPAILDLTKQQLRAGEATDILAEAVKGAAAALADTYEGAIDGVTTSWREFQKAVGERIVQSPIVRQDLIAEAGLIDILAEQTKRGTSVQVLWNEIYQATKLTVLETAAGLGFLIEKIRGVTGETRKSVAEEVRFTQALDQNTEASKLNSAQLDAQRSVTENLKEEMRALGIVLDEDLNKAIAEDTQLIEDAQDAWSRGVIKLDELVDAEEKFGARIEENKLLLQGHTVAQDDGTRAFGDFTEAAFDSTGAIDGYSVSLERARGELIDLQRQQTTGVPRASSVQVGGLDARPDQGGLFPGLSGTSYTYTFETSEEADDFVRRINQQSRGGP